MRKEIEKFIIGYLKEKKLKYGKADGDTLNVNFKGKDGRISLYIVAQEDGWIIFSTSDKLSIQWKLENKSLLALTIAELNFITRKGSFQFDISDGEIRYKIFTGLTSNMVSQDNVSKLLDNDIRISINMIIRHQEKLLAAVNGKKVDENPQTLSELKTGKS